MVVRHSSGEGHEQSSVPIDNETIDLTDEAIPEAPEVPIETIEQVEKVLVLISLICIH